MLSQVIIELLQLVPDFAKLVYEVTIDCPALRLPLQSPDLIHKVNYILPC